MHVIVCQTEAEVAEVAANKIAQIAKKVGPLFTLGVATGSSPIALYNALGLRVKAGELDFSHVSAFALDEYVGLPEGHPESYKAVIHRTVTEVMGLDPKLVHVPNGFAEDIEAACLDYEAKIAAAGGVDCQIVGIGSNGHIGFNEPFSSFSSRTRLKTLMPNTRQDNARFFDGELDRVPKHCVTQGLGTIMDAREVVMVAQGAGKSRAIADMVEGSISAKCPGSILQLHRHATVIIDEGAACLLEQRNFFKYTYEHRFDWQDYGDAK